MQGRVRTLTTFKTGDPIQDRFQEHVKQTLQPVIDNTLLNAVDFRWAEVQGADPSKTPTFVLQYRSTGTTWKTIWTSDATGQIAQAAWIAPTLLNSFANFGGGFQVAGYMKDTSGFVHLRGLVTNAGGVAGSTNIFVLPSGYRPSARIGFSSVGEVVGTDFRLDIDATGQVFCTAAVAAGGFRFMDGFSFDTRS